MVLPEINDDLALEIYTQSILSMQSDQLFQTPSGTTLINTIQELTSEEQIEIINFISSNQNVHSIDNPSTLPNHAYFQLARFITRQLGTLNNVNTAIETDLDISNISQSDDTLQGIYYVGGSIIRRLQKGSWEGEDREQITVWSIPAESGVPSAWKELVDRGGLLDISSEFYDILKLMDVIATACLQSVSIDCNLTEKVMGCILRQNQLLDLVTSVSTELLHSVAKMFTKVRCKAFVQGKVEYASTSLRQNLMGSHGLSK